MTPEFSFCPGMHSQLLGKERAQVRGLHCVPSLGALGILHKRGVGGREILGARGAEDIWRVRDSLGAH